MRRICIFLSAILLTSAIWSCRAKKVSTQTVKSEVSADIENIIQQQYESVAGNEINTIHSEVKELTELLESLNISYDGTDINDKLDLLLNKTEDGTKLTISGKGRVNYSNAQISTIESQINELSERQEAFEQSQVLFIQELKVDILEAVKTKDKEVETKGFQPGVWIAIIITVFVMLVLNAFYKWFKR